MTRTYSTRKQPPGVQIGKVVQTSDDNELPTRQNENFGQSKGKRQTQKSKKVHSSQEYSPRKLAKANTEEHSHRAFTSSNTNKSEFDYLVDEQQNNEDKENCFSRSSDISFELTCKDKKKEDTFDRLLKISSTKPRQTGNKENKDVQKIRSNVSQIFDHARNDHREATSFPSYSEAYISTLSSSEETNNSGKVGLFKSLLDNTDSISTSVESTKECSQLNGQRQKYKSKVSYKRSSKCKNIDGYKKISDSTLDCVVEGVEKLDIEKLKKTNSEPSANVVRSQDSQDDMFVSLNANAIEESDPGRGTSNDNVHLNTSDNQSLSPKICSGIERLKKIQLVSSTPVLTNTIKATASCITTQNKEHCVENMLFKTRESGVKPPSNKSSTPRLQLTPNLSYMYNKRNDIPSTLCDISSKKEASFIGGISRQSKSNRESFVPCKSEAQKLLQFDSPLKFSEQKIISVDMFDDLSISYQNNGKPKFRNVVDHKKSFQQIAPSLKDSRLNQFIQTQSAQNILQSDTKCNDNLTTKQLKLTFKCPNEVSKQNLIAIKKGGKNWRRTIMVPQSNRTSIDVTKRNTLEIQTMSRKSSIIIEQKQPSIRIVNPTDNIPKIVEVSIPGESQIDDTYHTDRMNVSIINHVESSPSVPPSNSVHLNNISQLNKSSSYILPLDRKSQSILLEPTHDIVSKVLSKCSEKKIILFDKLYDGKILNSMKKVGEGTYGEVFLMNYNGEPAVLKIVPVDGNSPVNGETQTKLSDMLAEIVVSQALTRLKKYISKEGIQFVSSNFIGLRKCVLVEGKYPEELLTLWDEYNEEKVSENERPDSNLFSDGLYSRQQRFIALEYEHGGEDLEKAVVNSALQGMSIFLQVAHSMAVAEKAFEFEHRDLHWGNILVRKTSTNKLSYNIGEKYFEIKTEGVHASVIDFSLSRMITTDDGCEIYNNLAEDTNLFICEGQDHDPPGDYQFDIYRMMRAHTHNDWKQFYPKTNIFWLHYLLDKTIYHVNYKNRKSKCHKKYLLRLKKLKDRILDFDSCQDFACWYEHEFNSN